MSMRVIKESFGLRRLADRIEVFLLVCDVLIGEDLNGKQRTGHGGAGRSRCGVDVWRRRKSILAGQFCLWGKSILVREFCLRGKVWLGQTKMKCGRIGAVLLV